MNRKCAFYAEYIEVNGISQYVLHYPAGKGHPVVLHVHGGPGAPDSVFSYEVEQKPRRFCSVYYDQRGSGRTFLRNPLAAMDMALLQQDLLETVLYLKRKYSQERIILFGHSWGSFLGSVFALCHPEHVAAYIGCGQMYCFTENEKAAYRILRKTVLKSGDRKSLRQLRGIGAYPAKACSCSAIVNVMRIRTLQGRFGLAMRTDVKTLWRVLSLPTCGIAGMAAFIMGGIRSASVMKEFWNDDLRRLGYAYQMPVFYLAGENDRTTPQEIARSYFEQISAPLKRRITISDAGHFAMLDNTQAFCKAMDEAVDVIGAYYGKEQGQIKKRLP